MLNKHGEGTLYFGVKNDETIVGEPDIIIKREADRNNLCMLIKELI